MKPADLKSHLFFSAVWDAVGVEWISMEDAMSERLLRLPEVMTRVGVRRSTLYREMERGTFPRPRKIGRASVWPESEVEAWIDSLSERGGEDKSR